MFRIRVTGRGLCFFVAFFGYGGIHMMILKAERLSKSWKDESIFDNVNIELAQGEHIALIGANGIGKTTLFHMLIGKTPPDEGSVHRYIPLDQWGWMEQHVEVEETLSLLEFVQSGAEEPYGAKIALEVAQRALDTASGKLARREDRDEPQQPQQPQQQAEQQQAEQQQHLATLEMAMDQYSNAYENYLNAGGYDWEIKVEKCLHSLEMDAELWNTPFMRLSGGQKTRAQLARLMVKEPQVLLLDEPTNHLDQHSLDWLEQWIRKYPGTVLFISHDRHFIDQVADATVELTRKGIKKYRGGYSDFARQREIEIQEQQKEYEKQERAKKDLIESIRQYKEWFNRADTAAKKAEMGGSKPFYAAKAKKNITRSKAKEKALERLENHRVDQPKQAAKVHVEFKDQAFEARTLVQMEQVSFAYADRLIFSGLNLFVERGDRIGIIGPNGSGKTTLIKLLTGQLQPSEGEVAPHLRLKIGYFAQQLEGLDPSMTILDCLLTLPGMTQTYARTILGCFLFSREDVYKKIGDLSMGERCRVAFVRLYFSGFNMLVLDEPTNYLDIETRERIEEALLEYPGALVVVSHDRYLTRKVANRIVDLNDGEVRQFPGTYDEYIECREAGARGEAPDRERANQIRQLELKLVQLMTQEEPPDSAGQWQLLQEIRETQIELRLLRTSEIDA
jgi:ATPase subunit of ABC transporter with duplicated ATPase domains